MFRAAEPSRDQAAQLLERIFRFSPTPVYLKDLEDRWIFSNEECSRVLGLPADAFRVGGLVRETLPPELAEMFLANDRQVLESGQPIAFTEEVADPQTGEPLHYISVKFPVRNADDQVMGVGGISFDATEHNRQERELSSSRALIATVFSALRSGILVMRVSDDDESTSIIDCNEAFCATVGRSREDLVGRNSQILIHPEEYQVRSRVLTDVLSGKSAVTEIRYLRPDGQDVWCMVIPAMTYGPDGERLIVSQVVDITERRAFERQLRHYAEHDALTGLLSRRHFTELLELEVTRVRATRNVASLLLLDLDGFKDVNDALGHSTGDALLRRIAAALSVSLREGDLLARFGGDEFAILLPNTNCADAISVGNKLVAAVHAHGSVLGAAGRIEVTASVGLTAWDAPVGIDGELLLGEADIAMYDAKAAGRNRVAVFERGQARRAEIASRSTKLTQLREAIAAGSFVLHGQPIVDLSPNAEPLPVGYELLVRLRRPDGVLALPDEFLPDAERHGLMREIDDWVLREAMRILRHRRDDGSRPVYVGVNLSAATVEDPGLGERIADLLDESQIPPRLLVLELTETGAISDLGRAQDLSLRLREIGCRFALDDFGAAFATLQYLKHIEFDAVKIDGEFVRNLPTSPGDQLIVKAVTEMAKGFGAKVVAEYVGSAQTAELLRSFGVDYAQGDYIGRPEPLL